MNVLEAKSFINRVITSNVERSVIPPDKVIEIIKDKVFVYLDDDSSVKASPKVGYIKSNIKGYYYIIYCDSCNARCRKVYPTRINTNNEVRLHFLCGKCAGKKYERKKEYEKKALEYLLHPEKLEHLDIRNLPLKECLAIMEAGYIQDGIRERAYRNLSKYIDE